MIGRLKTILHIFIFNEKNLKPQLDSLYITRASKYLAFCPRIFSMNIIHQNNFPVCIVWRGKLMAVALMRPAPFHCMSLNKGRKASRALDKLFFGFPPEKWKNFKQLDGERSLHLLG